jgi:hypothetical protein
MALTVRIKAGRASAEAPHPVLRSSRAPVLRAGPERRLGRSARIAATCVECRNETSPSTMERGVASDTRAREAATGWS